MKHSIYKKEDVSLFTALKYLKKGYVIYSKNDIDSYFTLLGNDVICFDGPTVNFTNETIMIRKDTFKPYSFFPTIQYCFDDKSWRVFKYKKIYYIDAIWVSNNIF